MQPQKHEVGIPLAPWTYLNAELFELEYESFFLSRWQFVGHINELADEGSFITANVGRTGVFVLRGKDKKLRAFLNVCRHRASRILQGSGECRGVVRCPYHGWTYRLDGTLMAVPQDENFPNLDRDEFGLFEITLENFHGLLFVRVKGDGPSVAEDFAHTGSFFEAYGIHDYVQIMEQSEQVWDVNWKVAWDNYLENYHIPIGHPGLHRLLRENDEWEELPSGTTYGTFELREKPSNNEVERQYQECAHHSNHRVPENLRGKWVQFSFGPGHGIDLYPEMMDVFQLVPLAQEKTLLRTTFLGHRDASPEELELRRLNLAINDSVNAEDELLCARVQQGLKTYAYQPGPLSNQETFIGSFHEIVRNRLPVAGLASAPTLGSVASENNRLTQPS